MANARGEVQITLGKKKYRMRPTFQCLLDIEDHCDMSVLALSAALMSGNIRTRFIQGIVFYGIHHGENNDPPDMQKVGDLLMETGFYQVQEPIIKFLESAVEFYSKGAPDPNPEGRLEKT